MNNILFFGASGRLGSVWVNNLLNASKKNKIFAQINNKRIKNRKSLNLINLNIDNHLEIKNFCQKNSINIIINCIANTNVDLCERFPKETNKTNYLLAKKLCEISKILKISYIFISTDMLFNGKSNKKYTERSKVAPLNVYAKTKLKAEKFVRKYKKSLIIRTNFFGKSNSNKVTFSDSIIKFRKKKIYLWKDIFFNPVHIKVLIEIINLLIKKKIFGTYNISSNKCISKFELGKLIEKKFYSKSILVENLFSEKTFVVRPKNMCLSNYKLLNKIGKLKKKLNLNRQIKLLEKEYK